MAFDEELEEVLLFMLESTLQPYLDIIQNWINFGVLRDQY